MVYQRTPGAPPAATDWTLPTGALTQTWPRNSPSANVSTLVSGSLYLVAVPLTAGQVVSTITFCSSTTALVTGSNQWFALYSAARGLLGVTNDDTSAAWAAESIKTLTVASPYTVLTSGLYYLGAVVVAATPPTLRCASTSARLVTGPPVLSGTSTAGLTNPASAPATAAAITPAGAVPWAYVS